ncbi:hypothetical protein NC651_003936 [Populus alba x Populus x berolinensis]|uniref:FMN-dependent dehydrogenase domain-containing protein n=1 Tax=Populus alba x Populus x berolinensis TaxID=444605 RepID=A0AAD6RU37_9ROSI|nr:hypothetical protein NC651_003936 [Populus alba x Populus x berolinensis]KAJ7014635.1 hypothetical protein NC653_004063 [Populus alba x Populus x berolinensis]
MEMISKEKRLRNTQMLCGREAPREYATARAASAAGTIMTLSSWATSSVEEVASTGPGIRFFQLYIYSATIFDIEEL